MRRLVVAAFGVLLLVSGCDSGPRRVTVAATSGAATLAPGDHLRVDLGPQDPDSVGDWFLLREPDPAVLTDNGEDFESVCPGGGGPCQGHSYWDFTAAGPGFASLAFQRCLDGTVPPNCVIDEIPLNVTVLVRAP